MSTDAPQQLLQQMCSDLRLLWTQAGGPTLRSLGSRVNLGKSQVGAILNGRIRRPPDWRVVHELITCFATYAREHGRADRLSLSIKVEEFWRPRFAVVEHAFDAAAEPVGPSPGVPVDARPTPRELPADVFGFTGRTAPLAELDGLIGDAGRGSAVVISALTGTAGVGKTALAVHWAHRVAHRFADGQLYVDLRGYHPSRPLPPADALATLLGGLGVPASDLPVDVDGRAARYRSRLAGKRMLILLDNASAAEQVRPLLPGTPGCVVVVTSRGDLPGLVARDGARRIDLDLLAPDEAVALLRALIGPRVDADPGAAEVLAEQCARLPLALRVAAELAAARPATPLAKLVDDLRDQGRRLDRLATGGDPHTAVRAVLSWSHHQLPAELAEAFALLGLHPGDAFDAYALAALAGTDLDRAGRLLDELTRANLVEPRGTDWFGMHDLLRAYAAERVEADLAGTGPAALGRLVEHLRHTAAAAMDAMYPDEHDIRPDVPAPATPTPPLDSRDAARAWLDRERLGLVVIGQQAAELGRPDVCVDLSQLLFRYLDDHPDAALMLHSAAVQTAPAAHPGRANALTNLGLVLWRLGRTGEAADRFQEAVAGHRGNADQFGEIRAVGNLGLVYESLGRFADALDQYQRVRVICHETGLRSGEFRLLCNLGSLYGRLGRLTEAIEHWQEAVTVALAIGDRRLETHALVGLGGACAAHGDHHDALDHLVRGMALGREFHDRRNEGVALRELGRVHAHLGDYAAGLRHLDEALALLREIGDQLMETETLNAFGETLRAASQPGPALDRHGAALTLARQTGDRLEEARALDGIAYALAETGQADSAGEHWRAALEIYADLDLPEADRIRDQLAAQPFASA